LRVSTTVTSGSLISAFHAPASTYSPTVAVGSTPATPRLTISFFRRTFMR